MVNDHYNIPNAISGPFDNTEIRKVLLTGPEQLPTNMKLAMITPVKVS